MKISKSSRSTGSRLNPGCNSITHPAMRAVASVPQCQLHALSGKRGVR
ncbi:MAG TPA: hypothetical protein PK014_05830 [Thermoanaerobaculia bacterium]|nr:hypothetical protein [Thermoanaerobaculia bacterium]HUM29615.1 hypothetical protein [Thermoanaerobaculia bacterium]HXK67266.1 hypothetical protein [Thermoanaerobaculia bacterium]